MSTVAKSYNTHADPVVAYCSKMTVVQHPLQEELQRVTLNNAPMSGMLGAPEVLTIGSNFMQLIGGKKAIDIGTFTGASALAWALAAGEGGQVYTLDINHANYKTYGVPVISKDQEVFKRIIPVEGPALTWLDEKIGAGQAGTYDFAFIDADKGSFLALWSARVTRDPASFDSATKAIHYTNTLIRNDNRTNSALLNCGDGLHIAFKK
ncbi:Catechol O-methyltransferase domain-containing protein 1 [Trichostrongylus colubriformis]|uniref:Catechol O-methyltransferase domain-containing protein 1 n=1 Tax=Trichostrongylus colubriformis TaxID=6319 RepID=A0AAN8IPG9_TRICO